MIELGCLTEGDGGDWILRIIFLRKKGRIFFRITFLGIKLFLTKKNTILKLRNIFETYIESGKRNKVLILIPCVVCHKVPLTERQTERQTDRQKQVEKETKMKEEESEKWNTEKQEQG